MTSKVLLGEVCEITMGQAPSGESYNTDNKGFPLIAGAGDFGDLTPEPTKFTTAPTKLSRPNEVILCIRATIGDRNWSDRTYCLGRGVAGLLGISGKLDESYLWHWLGHAAPELKAKGRGATFLQVSKADISSLEIPLPPLPEQRRIAATLDKVDALRAKRREAIAKIDQLLQSVFLNMFGEPVANPKGWTRKKLMELGRIQTGGTPPTGEDGMFEGTVPFVTPGDLGGAIDVSRRSLTVAGASKSRLAPAGSVLVCCIGATIGKMGYAQMECAFNQQINAITWDGQVGSKYGYYALRFFAEEIAHQGLSTTLPILKKSAFERLMLPVPPIGLQDEFEKASLQIENQRHRALCALHQSDDLFSSLQWECFSGGARHAG